LKEGAANRTLWRTRFGRGYEPALRHITKWICNLQIRPRTACGLPSRSWRPILERWRRRELARNVLPVR